MRRKIRVQPLAGHPWAVNATPIGTFGCLDDRIYGALLTSNAANNLALSLKTGNTQALLERELG